MLKLITIAMLIMMALSAQADDRRDRARQNNREHHDYIIERQQAGAVQGPPTDRLISASARSMATGCRMAAASGSRATTSWA